MARLLGQERQQDQLQIARAQAPAEAEAPPAMMARAAMATAPPSADQSTELAVPSAPSRTIAVPVAAMAMPAASIVMIFNVNFHCLGFLFIVRHIVRYVFR
jgi:hypothetical protein